MYSLFYNSMWTVAKPLVKLYFKKRSKKDSRYAEHLEERFSGLYPQAKELDSAQRTLHLHAASLGEVNLAKAFAKQLMLQSDYNLVISTNTPTGRASAQDFAKDYQGRVAVVYCPLEYTKAIKGFINAFNPLVSYFVETELWPLFIKELAQGRKLHLLNARLSTTNFEKYKKTIFKNALMNFESIICQSLDNALYFTSILDGLNGKAMQEALISGNLPFKVVKENTFQKLLPSSGRTKPQLYVGQNLKFNKSFGDPLLLLVKKVIADYVANYQKSLTLAQEAETKVSFNAEGELSVHPFFKESSKDLPFLSKTVVLIGSTYPDEGEILLPPLAQRQAENFTIIAPRHQENFEPLAQSLQKEGFKFVRLSQVQEDFRSLHQALLKDLENFTHHKTYQNLAQAYGSIDYHNNFLSLLDDCFKQLKRTPDYPLILNKVTKISLLLSTKHGQAVNALLVDTFGDLSSFYPYADLSVVGGTFNKVNGHDYIESAANCLTIISGPNCKQQISVVEALSAVDGIEILDNGLKLKDASYTQLYQENFKLTLYLFNREYDKSRAFTPSLASKVDDDKYYFQAKAIRAYQYYLSQSNALDNHLQILGFYPGVKDD